MITFFVVLGLHVSYLSLLSQRVRDVRVDLHGTTLSHVTSSGVCMLG